MIPRRGSADGVETDVPRCLPSDIQVLARVTSDEKRPTQPPARQVRTAAPPHGAQPRRPAPPPHPHPLGAVRGGARRAARADRPAEVLYLVSEAPASGTAPLGLQRTAERHVPLRRLPRDRRLDGYERGDRLSV